MNSNMRIKEGTSRVKCNEAARHSSNNAINRKKTVKTR